ncbi:hypothetical protein MRB53_031316 [Persea americana]|uniref:Uncharacterized protein n=1 Tax=Persea americana TaxID=3435 RepID=A0ACC2KPS9_PERAE|nr:hypothetical protein MRB53_031316 [Persea americana]
MNFNGLPATDMGAEALDGDSNINALDLPYDQWVSLPISGLKPSARYKVAREGQSVALVGSRLMMFGGEDFSRRLLNDLFILDLENMAWEEVETLHTPPAPRFDHTATVHAERYLLIFGGCSHSTCFNDLHALDLQSVSVLSPPQIIF